MKVIHGYIFNVFSAGEGEFFSALENFLLVMTPFFAMERFSQVNIEIFQAEWHVEFHRSQYRSTTKKTPLRP